MKLIFKQIVSLALALLGAVTASSAQICSSCQSGGSAFAQNEIGVTFAVSMGNAQYGQSAGFLYMGSTDALAPLLSPLTLKYDAMTREDVIVVTTNVVTAITNVSSYPTNIVRFSTNISVVTTDGVTTTNISWPGSITTSNYTVATIIYITNVEILQVQAPQTIADIPSPPTTNGYVIKYYWPSQVTGQVNGLDQFSGSPYTTWLITNGGGGIQISQVDASSDLLKQWTFTYDPGSQTWSQTSMSNLVQKSSQVTALGGDLHRITTTIQTPSGPVVQQAANTYQTFDWGTVLVTNAIGSSSSPQITSYGYDYSTFSSPAPLTSAIHPDGSGEGFGYDDSGRMTVFNFSFGDFAGSGKETLYSYDDGYLSGAGDDLTICLDTPRCAITTAYGSEIARSYTVFPSAGVRIDVQCTENGADWNAAENLFTTNLFYTSGANQFALKAVVRPGKTMATYDYVTNSAGTYQTNIYATGQPSSDFTHVINGTSNYTVINQFGGLVLSVTKDISSGIVLAQETFGDWDGYGRPQQVTHLDGTTEHATYSCCGLDTTTDKNGVSTQYYYDAAKRQNAYTRNGIRYTNILDAAGQVLVAKRIGTDNTTNILRQATYDLGGEILSETNALGGVTYYGRLTNTTTGGLIRTVTNPDGGVITNEYYVDGMLKRVAGSAARLRAYVPGSSTGYESIRGYGVAADGSSNEWTELRVDMVDRPFQRLNSQYYFPVSSTLSYNSLGQRTNYTDADSVTALFSYNAKGEPAVAMMDMAQTGTWALSGANPASMRTNDVMTTNGIDVHRILHYVWNTSSSTPMLASIDLISTDRLKSWHTVFNGANAVTSSNVTAYASGGYRYETNFSADGSFTAKTYQYRRLLSSVRKDSGGTQIAAWTFAYDGHGRVYQATDAATGTASYTYTNSDQVRTITTPAPASGVSPEVITLVYDDMGRNSEAILPDSTAIFAEYYPTGDLKREYGSYTYPAGFGYDSQGRIITMTNWSDFYTNAGARVTTWAYDPYTGFLTNKTYAGLNGPGYDYTDAGRVAHRYWARGIKTTYGYDHAGAVASISYDDSATPGLTCVRDRMGRATSVTQTFPDTSTAVCSLSYNDVNELLSESYSGGALDGMSVTSSYDSLLRRTNNLAAHGGTTLAVSTNDFDAASRLHTVSDGTQSATYSYLANAPLVSQIAFKQGATARMTTFKAYDNLNRLVSIVNSNATVFDSHAYGYNSVNLCTAMTNADGEYWAYGYDTLGQVTSGVKHWADRTPVAGQQFGYKFDDIGNRTNSWAGGDQFGANLRPATYTANALNQYTIRTVPGAVDIIGSATNAATVTVNGHATYRKGNYYRAQVPLSNGSAAVWQPLTNLATLNIGTNFVVETNINGNLFLPQTPESFSYDTDGNLTSDGRWDYVWDGENRLVSLTSHSGAPAGSKFKLEFVYDWMGRRVQKNVSGWTGSAYALQSSNRFVYDGWNVVAETGAANALVRSYLWGLDLGGSLRRAGGIGGLLEVSYYGAATTNCFVSFDKNGNVAALANASDGAILGQYEYGPFGELLRATGPMAKVNPFRFSTKYQDEETDFSYYGYRFYNPNWGRWINRDPIEEFGGINLYGFVGNQPINWVDAYGLNWYDYIPKIGPGAEQAAGAAALNAQIAAAGYVDAKDFAQSHPYYNPDNMSEVNAVRQIMDGTADLYLNGMQAIVPAGIAAKETEAAAQGIADAVEEGWLSKLWSKCFKSKSKKSVWDLLPFQRGREIEKMLGANLPSNFKTFDKFADGVATSIKSIDLNAITYQNANALESKISGYIYDVANFSGNELGDITGRQLQLAIPAGSVTPAQQTAINASTAYGQTLGVTVIVTPVK